MLSTRLMPCPLMRNGALVKAIRFKEGSYVGDPVNAVRIFNQEEVDELILLGKAAVHTHNGASDTKATPLAAAREFEKTGSLQNPTLRNRPRRYLVGL